jgi:hypothetical protein
MNTVIVTELYFVVRSDEIEKFVELPKFAYQNLRDAIKAADYHGKEWEVASYYKLWNIVQRNIEHGVFNCAA